MVPAADKASGERMDKSVIAVDGEAEETNANLMLRWTQSIHPCEESQTKCERNEALAG